MASYQGIHFEREDIVFPPFPSSGMDHLLLVTPQSLYFLQRNLQRIVSECGVSGTYIPALDLVSHGDLLPRVSIYENKVNDLLVQNGVPNWRIHFNQELMDIFQNFDEGLEKLPHYRPNPMRMLGIMLNKALIGPSTMHLDLHNGCNAKCVYCWFHSPTSDHRFDADWRKEMMPESIF